MTDESRKPTSGPNPNLALSLFFLFKILPMMIAGLSIFLGYRLFILGVTGKASLSIESETVSGQLLNAAPGLFFAVGGFVAIVVVVWKGASLGLDRRRSDESERLDLAMPPE